MADEGAEEVGAGGRGGALDDGPQPLLAQLGHALRELEPGGALAQRDLGVLALGHVDGGGEGSGLAVLQQDDGRREIDPPLAAVFGEDPRLVAFRGRLAAQAGRRPVAEHRLRLRGGEVPREHGLQLLGGVAGEVLAGRIDVEDLAGAVDEDGRGGGFGQSAEPLIGFAHRQAGRSALESWSHHRLAAFTIPVRNLQEENLPARAGMKYD
jgi:hypothetical protein